MSTDVPDSQQTPTSATFGLLTEALVGPISPSWQAAFDLCLGEDVNDKLQEEYEVPVTEHDLFRADFNFDAFSTDCQDTTQPANIPTPTDSWYAAFMADTAFASDLGADIYATDSRNTETADWGRPPQPIQPLGVVRENLRKGSQSNAIFGVGQLEEVLGSYLSTTENRVPNATLCSPVSPPALTDLGWSSMNQDPYPFDALQQTYVGVDNLAGLGTNIKLEETTYPEESTYPGEPVYQTMCPRDMLYGAQPFPNGDNLSWDQLAAEETLSPAHVVVPLRDQTVPLLKRPIPPRLRNELSSGNNVNAATKRKRLHNPDATLTYTDLAPFMAWGPLETDGSHMFSYDNDGPLSSDLTFDGTEIRLFLNTCPRGPVVWVQQAPAQCNNRLLPGESKCRYIHCPDPKRTILAGWLRAAFDENPELTSSGFKDPFKVSMAMHLWCFEQCVDPMEAYMQGRLAADERQFPCELKNPMAINKDTDTHIVRECFEPWFGSRFNEWQQRGARPRHLAPYESSLSHALVCYHLDNQIRSRQRTRNSRNSSKQETNHITIDVHKGDLALFLERRQSRLRTNPPGRRKTKSQRSSCDSFSSYQTVPQMAQPMMLSQGMAFPAVMPTNPSLPVGFAARSHAESMAAGRYPKRMRQ